MNIANTISQIWHRELPVAQLLQTATELSTSGSPELAAVLYQTWLARHDTHLNHLIHFNLGVLLFSLQDYNAAKQAYIQAIARSPEPFLQPRFNLGLVYEKLGNSAQALAQWSWIEQNARANHADERPILLLALNNMGRHLEDQGRYGDAMVALHKSLLIEPNQPDVIHHWIFIRAKQCEWPVYTQVDGIDESFMRKHTSALAMVSLSSDPQEQLEAARQYVEKKILQSAPRLSPREPYGHQKIRIAYCSSDLCMHPVAMLTVELFELHNREQFEVYVFDWSREDGSELRERIKKAADHFIPIHHLSDQAAAQLIRDQEIDVLIDLQGQTLGARPNMLAYRPARVQVTYLGLPATTGLPSIDYVIADRYLIPPEAQCYYSEMALYLPDVYQPSDRQRKHSQAQPRSAYGLPDNAFVFCCFNNNYKITPEVFAVWMNILQEVPNGVLWLLADNAWAQENLRRAAFAHGVDERRLVFTHRSLPEDYLAKYLAADLFLDCFPFNGGTTANDALWMGTPVLTLSGQTFASRMAGALLTAAQLPELITTTLEDYQRHAVALANDPAQFQAIKTRLAEQKKNGVLFDTPRLLKHLEQELMNLARRYD